MKRSRVQLLPLLSILLPLANLTACGTETDDALPADEVQSEDASGRDADDADLAVDVIDITEDATDFGDEVPDGDLSDVDVEDASDEAMVRGVVSLSHAAEVEGQGTDRVGTVRFIDGIGQVMRRTTVPALVYEVQEWAEYSYVLYHVLAPTNDDLNVLYLYCGNTSGTSFDYLWHESYDGAMAWEYAQGTCWAQEGAVELEIELNRLNQLPAPAQLVTGFAIVGAKIELGNGGGTLLQGGEEYDIYPFEVVDCTTECSADPADGWWELHSILERGSDDETCFGIIYLQVSALDTVVLTHGFCLDSLTPLTPVTLDASWSAPRVGKRSREWLPDGPRHPELGFVLRPSL